VSLPEQVTRAFLLRSVDYGESDRIVTLLTEQRGRVSAIARGARRSQKRFGGALEPFALLEVSLARGRGQLERLADASLLEHYPGLARDLDRVAAAAFVVEIVRELAPEDQPEPGLFDTLGETLRLVAEAEGTAIAALALAAALRVLETSGLALSADACNACGTAVPPGRRVLVDPRRGGVVCTPCGGGPITLSAPAAALLADLSREPLGGLAERGPDRSLVQEIEGVVEAFLEQRLERPLKSASFKLQLPRRRGSGR
jgi:DNA repair protein RecO (recombination protein O)